MGRLDDRPGPACDIELPEDLADMRLDGCLADAKLMSDLLIKKTLPYELKNPDLGWGEF